MDRSSRLIATLLLAATICVDVVGAYWLMDQARFIAGRSDAVVRSSDNYFRSWVLYEALATASVSIVVIWAVMIAPRRTVQWLAIVAAVILAALPTTWCGLLPLATTTGYFGGQALLLVVLIWALKQWSMWEHTTGQKTERRWQFSILDALALTTGAAIILTLIRGEQLLHLGWIQPFVPALVANAVLAAAAVAIHLRGHSALLGAAAVFLVAIAAGCAIGLLSDRVHQIDKEVTSNIIQATLLLLWVHLGGLIPQIRRATDAERSGSLAATR